MLRLPLCAGLVATCSASQGADAFAPVGAMATLSVDDLVESAGQQSREGLYDPYRWRVDETAQISVTDPIRAGKPRHRCSRNEVRQGAGESQSGEQVATLRGALGDAGTLTVCWRFLAQ